MGVAEAYGKWYKGELCKGIYLVVNEGGGIMREDSDYPLLSWSCVMNCNRLTVDTMCCVSGVVGV